MNLRTVSLCVASLLLAGCAGPMPRRTEPPPPARVRTLDEVLREADGLRCAFFDRDGRAVEHRASGAAGSVSIYRADGNGQDNYSFDERGRVVRHQRSYGEDFGKGIWTEAP